MAELLDALGQQVRFQPQCFGLQPDSLGLAHSGCLQRVQQDLRIGSTRRDTQVTRRASGRSTAGRRHAQACLSTPSGE